MRFLKLSMVNKYAQLILLKLSLTKGSLFRIATKRIKGLRDAGELIIIVQGPYFSGLFSTNHILKIYLEHYQGAIIIFSDTSKSKRRVAHLLKYSNFRYHEVDLPKYRGRGFINYQIASTKQALNLVKDLGNKYVIKSRSDQITLLSQETYEFMKYIAATNRIIVPTFNTYSYRHLVPSDMFQFGTFSKIFEYWQIPYEQRTAKNITEVEEFFETEYAEAFLAKRYFGKYGIKVHTDDRHKNLKNFLDHFYLLNGIDLNMIPLKSNPLIHFGNKSFFG